MLPPESEVSVAETKIHWILHVIAVGEKGKELGLGFNESTAPLSNQAIIYRV